MIWSKGEITIRGGTFARNAAQTLGGVLDLSEGSIATLVGGKFEGNTAWWAGGAVSVRSGGELLVKGGDFRENDGTTTGGAISIDHGGNVKVRAGDVARRSRGHQRIDVSPADLVFIRPNGALKRLSHGVFRQFQQAIICSASFDVTTNHFSRLVGT